ncbi:Imidazolonepropionase [Desulfotomaculum arcticum]|uniref:Imidazolonepropionase n=1 Tax=Desulfotruncus arcticus DSM 17038 TaxID=1121424 RepID=A0A1I2N4L4_9FIRM|nr:amidohydrolase [Desulfotruncus arcticus]SFF98712.1 Imidazolonepropionase [Desulfotomaculum arcticum] [Desulfotruncus arcticus DSM 17038]
MHAIIGGTVFTMRGPVLTRGTILIEKGKILAVGNDIKIPKQADIYDATGMVVMPGFIDAHTHLGIVEEIYRIEGDDVNENTDPVTPHLRAIDAVNPADLGFKDALAAGITTVVTGPGSSNIIGGEMAVIKTCGTVIDDMIVRFPVGLKAALGENPKRNYGENKKSPATRMASAAILRETLVKGLEYLKKINQPEQAERDLKMEAIARVLRREIPLRVHAHRADDIMTALRIGAEFNLLLIIEHCTEGQLIADRLASAGIPAVVGPVMVNRAKVELKERSLETAAALAQKGVNFAIMTDHPVVPIQYLTISAGLTVRGGLSEEQALKSITINAARLIGLDNRIGSIAQGMDGDIVILSGHPFDLRTIIKRVYVNGKVSYQDYL